MTDLLAMVKSLKKKKLEINIRAHLRKTYDWKVSKSISTGVPLNEIDVVYRNNITAEYNRRIEKLDNATTQEEIDSVPFNFV